MTYAGHPGFGFLVSAAAAAGGAAACGVRRFCFCFAFYRLAGSTDNLRFAICGLLRLTGHGCATGFGLLSSFDWWLWL
jgi:hypothetical protein